MNVVSWTAEAGLVTHQTYAGPPLTSPVPTSDSNITIAWVTPPPRDPPDPTGVLVRAGR